MCSSEFITTKWTTTLYGYGNQTKVYSQLDRPLLSKHLQILGWFCNQSQIIVNIKTASLYSRSLLSIVVFPRAEFIIRVNQTIANHFNGLRADSENGIQQFVAMYRTNLIVNAFNTDWTLQYGDISNGYLLRNVPRLFANSSCNCVLSGDCQQPLRIGPPDLVLPGLVVGCTPMHGFRLSTLECLFSSNCTNTILNYLHYYTQDNGSEPSNFTIPNKLPLSAVPLLESDRGNFKKTDRIGSLLDASFIDQSNQTVSYENYFAACSPSNCYYTYVKSNDILYILTSLLGLYGGLTISLRLIIWNAARIYQGIKRRIRTRATPIEPFTTENTAN